MEDRRLRGLFPDEAVIRTASREMWDEPPDPQEEPAEQRMVPRRRREFRAGRACAREVLSLLGIEDHPLLSDSDRLPVWPPGIVGSISHTRNFCAVVAARLGRIRGLGLDVETADPLEAGVVPLICIPRELEWVAARPDTDREIWPKLFFSAKESVYKSLYPLTRQFLEFSEVSIEFSPDDGTFRADILTRPLPEGLTLLGRWRRLDEYVVTGATLVSRGTGP